MSKKDCVQLKIHFAAVLYLIPGFIKQPTGGAYMSSFISQLPVQTFVWGTPPFFICYCFFIIDC